jgi:hypothetical protein
MNNDVFLSAEWRWLVMANYAIDPALLTPYVPRGVELDTWQGRHYVSLVAFLFLDTRVAGWPIPFHRNFEEVNLRFYVRRNNAGEGRRGVVFIKELVPRAAIAAVARWVYNENYQACPMRHTLERDADYSTELALNGRVSYAWRVQGRWHRLAALTTGTAQPLAAGSEEEFITEHYWGYAAQRDSGCVEYRVEHPPWRVRQVARLEFDGDPTALYGAPFAETLSAQPLSAFVAEGSPITVQRGMRIC